MDYQYLPPAQRAAIIQSRLAGLERDHLNTSLDVQAAGNLDVDNEQATRLAKLEQTIAEMRALKAAADAEVADAS
jgi:hypothetical protein